MGYSVFKGACTSSTLGVTADDYFGVVHNALKYRRTRSVTEFPGDSFVIWYSAILPDFTPYFGVLLAGY